MHVQQILTLVQSRSRATARARNEYNAAQQPLNYVHRCQHRLTDGAGCGEKAYFEGRDHVLPFYTNVEDRRVNSGSSNVPFLVPKAAPTGVISLLTVSGGSSVSVVAS